MAALRGHRLSKHGRFSTAPPGYIDACVVTRTCRTLHTDIRVPKGPWSVMPTHKLVLQQQCAGCSVYPSIIKLASKVSDARVPSKNGLTGELPAPVTSSTCPVYTTFSSPTSYCPSAALPTLSPLDNIGCWLNISDHQVATITPGTVSDTTRNSSYHLNNTTSAVGPTAAATVTIQSNTEAVAHWIPNSYTCVTHALSSILTMYDWQLELVQVAHKTRDATAAAAQYIYKIPPALTNDVLFCTTPGTITIIIIKCLVWLYCYWYFTTHGASGLRGLVAVKCPLNESVILKPNIWTAQQLVQLALVWSATSCLDTTSHLAAAVVYRLAAAGALYLGPMHCSRLCECVYVLHCDLALSVVSVCSALLSATAFVISFGASHAYQSVKLVYTAPARCLDRVSAHLASRLHQLHHWCFYQSSFTQLVCYMDFDLVVDLPGLSDDDIHAFLAVADNRLCVCLEPHTFNDTSGVVFGSIFSKSCQSLTSSACWLYRRAGGIASGFSVHCIMLVHQALHAVAALVQFTACKVVCVCTNRTPVTAICDAAHSTARGLHLFASHHAIRYDAHHSPDAYGEEGDVAGPLDTGQLLLQHKPDVCMMGDGRDAAAGGGCQPPDGCFRAVHDGQLAVQQPLLGTAACLACPCVSSSEHLGCSLLVSEGGDVVVVVAVGGGQCQKGVGDDGLLM